MLYTVTAGVHRYSTGRSRQTKKDGRDSASNNTSALCSGRYEQQHAMLREARTVRDKTSQCDSKQLHTSELNLRLGANGQQNQVACPNAGNTGSVRIPIRKRTPHRIPSDELSCRRNIGRRAPSAAFGTWRRRACELPPATAAVAAANSFCEMFALWEMFAL